MKDLFKRTMLDIDMYSTVLKSLAHHSLALGLDENHMNVQRVHLKTDAALRDYISKDQEARAMGYESLAVAWKAFKQIKDKPFTIDYTHMPEIVHKVPMIWLKGKPNSPKKRDGFAPMTPRQAKAKHKQLMPLFSEVWNKIDGDEALQNEIINAYLTTSAASFETVLFAHAEEIEDYELGEEEDTTPTLSELIRTCRATRPTYDYGVGGDLDEVVWD